MKRKLLQKAQDKTFIRYLDKDKVQQGIYIFERNDKDTIKQLQEYAIKNDLDILYYPNTIALSKEQWRMYYKGMDIRISKKQVYEMDTLFIDIDMPLFDNYYQLEKALRESGINNYKVYESATGNIHLYIKVVKFQDTRMYKALVKTIGNYLRAREIEIDPSSSNAIQKTYLESFRVLSKKEFSSQYIKELSHRGELQTPFQVLKEMYQRGAKVEKEYSMKYAMYILQDELQYNYSGVLHLRELERKYLIPTYTFSRALGVLQDFKAIEYRTLRGAKGYIQVIQFNENNFNRCKEQQMTRRENYFYINILQVFKTLRNVYIHLLHQCCKYIEKSIGTFTDFISRYIQDGYVQGLLSGNSGHTRDKYQVQKHLKDKIQIGNRNTTLYKALVRAKYQGANDTELEKLAMDLYSRMQQDKAKPFRKTEIESVLRWSKRITLYKRTF
jgi:hypothetical protein